MVGEQQKDSPSYAWRQIVGLLLGPAVFAAILALHPPAGLTPEGWRAAAVGMLMAIWWISEAIPIPATALLPLVALPALGVGDIEAAAAPYANPLIFLFLGGFLIALAIQRWNLHRRIALHILIIVGGRPRAMIAGVMAATALLSMWVSNTATAAIMLPVALSLIDTFREGESEATAAPATDVNFAIALMLGIAYGATIGGVATLIGTPPNALFAAYMLEAYGREIGFAQWMGVGLPLVAILLPAAWFVLTRITHPVSDMPTRSSSAVIRKQLQALGPMTLPEKMTAGVFALTAVLWITRPLLAGAVPESFAPSDPQIALFGALLLFVLPAGRGRFLLDWEWAARVPWRVLILFGGGLSLAAAISASGLANWIGGSVSDLGDVSPMLIVLTLTALIVFLTELTSNTATTAAFLPVVGATAVGLGHDPAMLAAPTALAASCAFMMPVATPPNAIVFASGHLTIPQMCRAGFLLNLVCITVITVVGHLLIGWLLSP